VTYVAPPRWMVRVLGRAISKFLWGMATAVRHAPDLVMGYHFVPAAVSALLIARFTGAKAAYQVTGGPVELIGGGAGIGKPDSEEPDDALGCGRTLACVLARGLI